MSVYPSKKVVQVILFHALDCAYLVTWINFWNESSVSGHVHKITAFQKYFIIFNDIKQQSAQLHYRPQPKVMGW